MNFNRNRSLKNGLPQLNNPVASWSIPITLIKIVQSIVDGDRVETQQKITFKGVVQPLTDEKLQYKEVGERSWSWFWIHAVAGTLNLQTQDRIIWNNKKFKVMSVKDYSLYGYIEYEVILDYQ